MKFPKLLKASGSNEILAVIENLPVNANGYFLTEEQATSIETALSENENPASLQALQQQLAEVTTARETAEAALVTANGTIATHVATIGTHQARITELENDTTLTQTSRDKDQLPVKTPSYLDDTNPVNAAADKFFGKPIPKKDK